MQRLSGPHSASATELKARIEAERTGVPFLILRDDESRQHLIALDATRTLTVGRSIECDIALPWDEKVSRTHAELVRVGGDWAINDGGLSRNGSYLNGERVRERRRLNDGDTIRFGHTAVLFRRPNPQPAAKSTVPADEVVGPEKLSQAQRAVLRALCRPFADADNWARPATNRDIADELFLSLDAVKGHLRVLFAKFGLDYLPQNEKRLRLAERAFATGLVSLSDLR